MYAFFLSYDCVLSVTICHVGLNCWIAVWLSMSFIIFSFLIVFHPLWVFLLTADTQTVANCSHEWAIFHVWLLIDLCWILTISCSRVTFATDFWLTLDKIYVVLTFSWMTVQSDFSGISVSNKPYRWLAFDWGLFQFHRRLTVHNDFWLISLKLN